MSRTSNGLFGWALAVLAMALFCSLGVWQLDRGKQKQAMLAQSQGVLTARMPLPLRAAADPARAAAYDWAQGQGRFLDKPAVLLDNQTSEGRSGVRVYRVFQPGAPQGDAAGTPPVLVELGWLPLPGDRSLPRIDSFAATTQVAGLLAPPPSAGLAAAVASPQADGNLLATSLDHAVLSNALKLPTLAPRVLRLDPALKVGYLRDLDILPNTLPPERHLGYAVQWFGLALAVLITALVLTLRKRRRHSQAA
ncbi:Cytochrome oxidase assembly protein ShyY1 [Pseudoxanthomonas sp. CF125]|nr:Cytochrome oxidase assembly protein ShyY1 [Pseudoxanthomonas sp. CF125]